MRVMLITTALVAVVASPVLAQGWIEPIPGRPAWRVTKVRTGIRCGRCSRGSGRGSGYPSSRVAAWIPIPPPRCSSQHCTTKPCRASIVVNVPAVHHRSIEGAI